MIRNFQMGADGQGLRRQSGLAAGLSRGRERDSLLCIVAYKSLR